MAKFNTGNLTLNTASQFVMTATIRHKKELRFTELPTKPKDAEILRLLIKMVFPTYIKRRGSSYEKDSNSNGW